jgi:opacity protein-like surface antigen
LASPALAGGYSIGVMGGLASPTSDFGDAYDSGYNVGGMLDYKMNALFGVGLDAGYHSENGSELYEAVLTFGALLDGMAAGTKIDDKVNAFQYGLHTTLTPPILGPIHPYAQLGVGAYSLKEKAESSDPNYNGVFVGEISKTLFGWNAGAGIDFSMVPTTSLGIVALYHDVNSKDDFGSNATWFAVNAKLTFHIPLAK